MKYLNCIEKQKYYINQLLRWLEINKWAGWDPYDLWDTQFGRWISKRSNVFERISSLLIARMDKISPLMIRKAFGAKPRINAKAMGLFASSFLYLEKIKKTQYSIGDEYGYIPCFKWLTNNQVTTFGGCGWGYPFDWQSRILIPKNTPTVVNSTIIGDAFWIKYKMDGENSYLETCKDICHFIFNALNRSGFKGGDAFCFSYTPLDTFQVHNANLFAAEFLLRIGLKLSNHKWVKAGLDATRFSLSEIRDDGSLNYWSNEQAINLHQDMYHSGFEIRAFASIAEITGDIIYRKAAEKYFKTWLSDFFSNEGKPCLLRGQHNVIESHSCAEALLCIVTMFEGEYLSESLFLKYMENILSALDTLWVQLPAGKGGYFAARKYKYFLTNIPYIRWSQAWILLAMSRCMSLEIFND